MSAANKMREKLEPLPGISPFRALTHPSYTLKDRTHLLPPPVLFKENFSAIDTWPATHVAHTAPTAVQATLTPNANVFITAAPEQPRKPHYLEQLESYLHHELRLLRCPDKGPSLTRLQVFREVFEYLINDFKTYQNLLAAIKQEYELVLRDQEERLKELDPLRAKLDKLMEANDKRMQDIRQVEAVEIEQLKREKQALVDELDASKEERYSLKQQIDRLQEEVEKQYQLYRNEADARKMLISDIIELKYRVDAPAMKSEGSTEKDDTTLIKFKLNKTKEDLAKLQDKLNEVLADYGDVVPRREYERIEALNITNNESLERYKTDYDGLIKEHQVLLEQHKIMSSERDEFSHELGLMKRSATPRPEWDQVIPYIDGGEAAWKEMSAGKSSNQLVAVLVGSLVGKDNPGPVEEFFEGEGTEPPIPKYLRWTGKVRNRNLSKADTAQIIQDIWNQKIVSDTEKEHGTDLADFLHSYLQQKYQEDILVVEWGYNIHHACGQYRTEPHIGLFYETLTGDADDSVYSVLCTQHEALLSHLYKASLKYDSEGTLLVKHLSSLLQTFYPLKDAAEVEDLVGTLADSEKVNVKSLFGTEREGNISSFLKKLYSQFYDERALFVTELHTALASIAGGDKKEYQIQDLCKAFEITDPEKNSKDVNKLLAKVFNLNMDQLSTVGPVDKELLLQRLKSSGLARSGPKGI